MRGGALQDGRPWWRTRLRRQEVLVAYLFVLPWIIGFIVFTAGPILVSFGLSFTHYKIITPATFAGLDNYTAMIRDRNFWQSLRVTTIYTLGSVPLNVVVGYSLALMLNQKIKGLSFWRTTFFMPSIVPILAVSYLFAWIFNPNIGLVNGLLRQVGIQGPEWFSSREWVIPTFIIMSLWGVGGGMVLYLAALQGVPTVLYDAAKADGANAWHRFYHVTLPLTSPVIFFNFLMGLIGSFQVFASAFFITSGGPANASLFYVLYLFRNGWEYFRMGYASALAWVLFLIIMAATLATFKLSGRLIYYETLES